MAEGAGEDYAEFTAVIVKALAEREGVEEVINDGEVEIVAPHVPPINRVNEIIVTTPSASLEMNTAESMTTLIPG